MELFLDRLDRMEFSSRMVGCEDLFQSDVGTRADAAEPAEQEHLTCPGLVFLPDHGDP